MASRKVFIANDMFVAFIDRAHPKHIHAVAFFRYFATERFELYSNIPIVIASYQKIYQDISPSIARDFLRSISLGNINIIYPDESEFKNALKALITYQSTELTFDEALMAVEADKRRIPAICTFEYLHPLFGLSTFFLPI